jgi:hypothetical protein
MSTFCRRREMAGSSCICSSSRTRHVTFRSSRCLKCCQTQSTPFGSRAYAGSALPALDRLFVALDGTGDGNLRRPAQGLEEARNVALVIVDADSSPMT